MLLVGMADPTDLAAFDDLARLLKRDIDLAVVTESQLMGTIDRVYTRTEEISGLATSTTTTTTGTVVTPSLTLEPYFSGISLDVTPQIDEEGNIVLHVHPMVSVVSEKTKRLV